MSVPVEKWQWYGNPGHYVCASRCRFHLCTKVGKYLISSVGEMYKDNSYEMEDIGLSRKFETFVFNAGPPCKEKGCECGMPSLLDACEIDSLWANDRKTANKNHLALCRKWAKKDSKRA